MSTPIPIATAAKTTQTTPFPQQSCFKISSFILVVWGASNSLLEGIGVDPNEKCCSVPRICQKILNAKLHNLNGIHTIVSG